MLGRGLLVLGVLAGTYSCSSTEDCPLDSTACASACEIRQIAYVQECGRSREIIVGCDQALETTATDSRCYVDLESGGVVSASSTVGTGKVRRGRWRECSAEEEASRGRTCQDASAAD